jgi:hypothetical protein
MNTVAADTGGISPSAKSRIILLFTGESGKQYGYLYDGFREDGTFWYTGEGRHGDMRMTKETLQFAIAQGMESSCTCSTKSGKRSFNIWESLPTWTITKSVYQT